MLVKLSRILIKIYCLNNPLLPMKRLLFCTHVIEASVGGSSALYFLCFSICVKVLTYGDDSMPVLHIR